MVSNTTATVKDTATGGLLEYWKLSSTNAYDSSSQGAGWTLVTSTNGAGSPGTDQFALQALFVSSNAAAADCQGAVTSNNDWDATYAKPLTTNPAYYTTTGTGGYFADQTSLGGSNGDPDITSGGSLNRMRVFGSGAGLGQRGLCYRIIPPTGVSSPNNQILYVIVTAASS